MRELRCSIAYGTTLSLLDQSNMLTLLYDKLDPVAAASVRARDTLATLLQTVNHKTIDKLLHTPFSVSISSSICAAI